MTEVVKRGTTGARRCVKYLQSIVRASKNPIAWYKQGKCEQPKEKNVNLTVKVLLQSLNKQMNEMKRNPGSLSYSNSNDVMNTFLDIL